MNDGFSILEVLVALTLSVGILTIVIANITQSSTYSQRVMTNQEIMESIFHTVDAIKSDLTKCGMRLQEAKRNFDLQLFENTDSSFKVTYGLSGQCLTEDAFAGEKIIRVERDEFFKKGKKVLIYHPDNDIYEINEITGVEGDSITLSSLLTNDYFKNSIVVVLKEVEYKLYPKQCVLKRKADRGYFQPLVENVTDFYVKFFPESDSVLYRIEVNKKEQVRGYVFLVNMI